MDKICAKCVLDPTSHSFKYISGKNNMVTFYSNPGKTKLYKDKEGILNHLDNALTQINKKNWRWIIDGNDFETKHALEIDIGMAMLELIMTKYNDSFKELILINPSIHMKAAYKLGMAFMEDDMKKRVKMLDDKPHSVLEFM